MELVFLSLPFFFEKTVESQELNNTEHFRDTEYPHTKIEKS